jgi:hypothetical protein
MSRREIRVVSGGPRDPLERRLYAALGGTYEMPAGRA